MIVIDTLRTKFYKCLTKFAGKRRSYWYHREALYGKLYLSTISTLNIDLTDDDNPFMQEL